MERKRQRQGRAAADARTTSVLWHGDWPDTADQATAAAPAYDEIISGEELRDAAAIADRLREVDWAFTADDTSYLTHDIHPYPAKFIPQIPGHLIARLSLRGELVFDPFGGSGTTALEAVRMGRRALSVDANPLATLIGQVKTSRIDKAAIADLHAIRTSLLAHSMILPKDAASTLQKYSAFVPDIPNREKWFPASSCGELALIRSCIANMESEHAKRVALLALSRVVLKVSFQDSETRYASRPREIPVGEALSRFLAELDEVVSRVVKTSPDLRYGVVQFATADARDLSASEFHDESVDLVVTSPPYGNAFDYHLYHRFRLLWLGHDPRALADIEIGSHLRHQRSDTGFDSYLADIKPCLQSVARLLRAGRYAAFVVGDPRYDGKTYRGAESVADVASGVGLSTVCIIERPIHRTKRSMVIAGRRASQEKILVLRKQPATRSWSLEPPPYKLWPYEACLRQRETVALLGAKPAQARRGAELSVTVDPYLALRARRLTFSHAVRDGKGFRERTWQSILENGLAGVQSARKDPKYATHGLHAYKGKFYPQLAKGLINLASLPPGSVVLDPFCGSGTTLLECYLNGLKPFGCDMHPLAAKIAAAKVGILEVSPAVVSEAVSALMAKMDVAVTALPDETDQFAEGAVEEIRRWFAEPVVRKLNWLLRAIRSVSAGVVRDFLEVVLSSIVREISQQDPSDLRIRRRKEPLSDADVLGQFRDALSTQYARIEKFWMIRGYCPYKFYPGVVREGDSRDPDTFARLGLATGSVDFVLTSPPYATALPYIDTDRLSLLLLFGMDSSQRRPLEEGLTGSREIRPSHRRVLEDELEGGVDLPRDIGSFLGELYERNSRDGVGFRRRNMPSLLLRFFRDMQAILKQCAHLMRPGAEAMIVVGDSRTVVDGEDWVIPTTRFIEMLGKEAGLESVERIPITVTTDNHKHVRNAITENAVIRLKCPPRA